MNSDVFSICSRYSDGEFYSVGKVHMEFDLLAEDVKGRAGDILKYDVPQIEN